MIKTIIKASWAWSGILSCCLVAIATVPVLGQTSCVDLGQNPSTAFPVCATSVFEQTNVTLCGGRPVINAQCGSDILTDRNPYWYKFTCFQSGTLGLTITPNDPLSDYDWQIFDISGRNPNDVLSDAGLTIGANWSQYTGETGTQAGAANLIECGGDHPKYSKMPQITKGREYLLFVGHYTNTQKGYKLEFKGGSAVIVDPAIPNLDAVTANCDGTTLTLTLNKKVRCNSLAADGSGWKLQGPTTTATITAAEGEACSNSLELGVIKLTVSQPLAPGTYTITSQSSTTGTILKDFCDLPLPTGAQLSFQVLPALPAVFEAIASPGCAPTTFDLEMSLPIRCGSIADDGSDFTITGPAPVNVIGIDKSLCINGLTKTIRLKLDKKIEQGGDYTIHLKAGNDGNTLINDCSVASLPGQQIVVSAAGTVKAMFTIQAEETCEEETITLQAEGGNGIQAWNWKFSPTGETEAGQTLVKTFDSQSELTIGLEVTNGICTDFLSLNHTTRPNLVEPALLGPQFACPNQELQFADASTGPVTSWFWSFGNGETSDEEIPPPQLYASGGSNNTALVNLTVTNALGCSYQASSLIEVASSCILAIPTAFTPNGDGLNDRFGPLNGWLAKDLLFEVFDRFGNKVFSSRKWSDKWDGRFKGMILPNGNYAWYIRYFNLVTNEAVENKGTVMLIR